MKATASTRTHITIPPTPGREGMQNGPARFRDSIPCPCRRHLADQSSTACPSRCRATDPGRGRPDPPHEVDERSGIVAQVRRPADRAQPAKDRFLAEEILRIHYRQRTLLSPY